MTEDECLVERVAGALREAMKNSLVAYENWTSTEARYQFYARATLRMLAEEGRLCEPGTVEALEKLEARFNEEGDAAKADAERYRGGKDPRRAFVAATLSTCGDTWKCAARAVHEARAALKPAG